jgi:hypothetical protein
MWARILEFIESWGVSGLTSLRTLLENIETWSGGWVDPWLAGAVLCTLAIAVVSRHNKWLVGAIVVGFTVRYLPLYLWPDIDCTRDECIYKMMANTIVDGEGLPTSRKGWLTAPGYPYLLALSEFLGDMPDVKKLQLIMAAITTWAICLVGTRAEDARTGNVVAWLYALHPTIVFFTGTMWTETAYTMFLMLAVLSLMWAREGVWWRALLPGLFVGICVLFRGAATYLAPIWVVAALLPNDWADGWKASLKREMGHRFGHALAFVVAVIVTVAPYSVHASKRHGGFMISDATIGHVLYLGNNDFEPLTFDYGNGMLTGTLYSRYLHDGRRACSRRVPPVKSSKCETKAAMTWAKENPGEFLGRIPLRNAQLFNPNTFFTRHLRWGYWRGVPWLGKELLVLTTLLTSYSIIVLGTVAAFARGRGVYGVLAIGTVCYHVAIVSMMYGMSRFRLPLEGLWLLFLAGFMAHPRETLRMLVASKPRLIGALITAPILFYLTSWFALTGYPGLWR